MARDNRSANGGKPQLPRGNTHSNCHRRWPRGHRVVMTLSTAWPGISPTLQRLKGEGLSMGLHGESGLGEGAVDECGPVLDALEPALEDGGASAPTGHPCCRRSPLDCSACAVAVGAPPRRSPQGSCLPAVPVCAGARPGQGGPAGGLSFADLDQGCAPAFRAAADPGRPGMGQEGDGGPCGKSGGLRWSK